MALYVHPENQKLLWYAIQTSPLFSPSLDNTEWFKSIISKFYSNCPVDISTDKLKELNMDTIVYMVRDLKRLEQERANKRSEPFQLAPIDGFNSTTFSPSEETGKFYEGVKERENLTVYDPNPEWLFTSDKQGNLKATECDFSLPLPENKMVHNPIPKHDNALVSHPGIELSSVSAVNTPWAETLTKMDTHDTSSWKSKLIEQELETKNRKRHDELTGYNLGTLNPLFTPIITKCLNIDTRFRDNLYTTSSTNFTFNLPSPLKKVISMQLTAYELPVTFYGISSSYGNNYMHINCTFQYPSMAGESVQRKTIIVPDGNYSAIDLVKLLNSQLRPMNQSGYLINTAIDGTNNDSIFNCIQFSFDITDTGSGSAKISIGLDDPIGFAHASVITDIEMDFTLDINGNPDTSSITSKLGWNLGFIQPQYMHDTTYSADTLPEPASLRYVYLAIDDFNNNVNNSFVAAFNNYILNNNILARIPVNAQYFNILMENDLSQHTEPRRYFGPVDIYRLHIQLLDDHGRVLDINKANYSLCLTFKMLNE